MTLLKYMNIFLLVLLHGLTGETEPGNVLTSILVLHKYIHKSEAFLNLLLALVLPAPRLDCIYLY